MSSKTESLCRICLGGGANIPIFEGSESSESNSTVQNKLSVCLNEKFEDVHGYPRYICHQCQVTLNTVHDFINKYKETCKILQNSLQAVVKEEYAEVYDDFVYLEDSIIESFDLKSSKTEVNIEFEDGTHFLEKIKPLCKLKTDGKTKSKKVDTVKKKTIKKPGAHFIENNKPLCKLKADRKRKIVKADLVKNKTINKLQKNTLSLYKTNIITTSLLEGEFIWNGEDWCNTSPQKADNRPQKAQVENKKTSTQVPHNSVKKALDFLLCELCGEKFKSRVYLKSHIDIKHNDQTVKCSICNVVLSAQLYLSRHMKRVHGNKDCICSKCGKGFVYERDLSIHIKVVHEKLKSYKITPCKFCNRYFKNKKSLIIHERSAHTGDRPAVCAVCDASFFHEDYLKEHMRLHTGERPFECPVCARAYAQRGNMKSHMRNHRISELSQEILSKIKPSWYRFMKP